MPVSGDAERMKGAAATLLLLLLSGRAAFTVCRALNAPQDGGVLPPDGQTDGTDGLTATDTGKSYLADGNGQDATAVQSN